MQAAQVVIQKKRRVGLSFNIPRSCKSYLEFFPRKVSLPQCIPSWTGFHMRVRNAIVIPVTLIKYLDCIDATATEISTILPCRRKMLEN